MPATEYTRNKHLDHSLGLSSWTMPTVYAALYDGDPDGAGTEVETPGVDGYNRQALTPNAASGGVSTSSGAIVFGANTGAGTWNVTHFAVFDATSGGNKLWTGPLTNRSVATNESYTIPDEGLTFEARAAAS